ncbi:MAG: radical SAM protein [Candidatus Hodarchaeales archaeon]|jgi:hypothetical protein
MKFNLDIETNGNCNRYCPTCIRNSYPDREKVSSWFESSVLSARHILDSIEQATRMDEFSGTVCLSHYNEPLMDKRIGAISERIRALYPQVSVYLHTNGDFLTQKIVDSLDGALERIVVTLYTMGEVKKFERAEIIQSFFKKTEVNVIIESKHIPTHFSPAFDVVGLAKQHQNNTCLEPSMRIIINHRRQYLMCCDDLVGHFDLGTFPEKSLKQHWDEKQEHQQKLSQTGGRKSHMYCATCPRP